MTARDHIPSRAPARRVLGRRRVAGYNGTRSLGGRVPGDESSELADAVADLPGAAPRRGAADEVRGPAGAGGRQGPRGGSHLRPRVADRLARRLPGPAPQADHDARPDDGPARRQAADVGGVHRARPDGSGQGLDGGGHHRSRTGHHGAPEHRLLARRDHRGVADGQGEDGRRGRGHPRHDPRARSARAARTCSPCSALWVAVITAVVSAVDYYRKFVRGQGGDVRIKGSRSVPAVRPAEVHP